VLSQIVEACCDTDGKMEKGVKKSQGCDRAELNVLPSSLFCCVGSNKRIGHRAC
jgi:hypothetical protein